jgi:branched-chain amino acid transport system permease protein
MILQRTYAIWLSILAIVIFLVLPITGSYYILRVCGVVFLFAIMAQALNIFVGYLGRPSFGHVVFFGIGAYVSTLIIDYFGIPSLMAILLGGLASFVFALLIGPAILKLAGAYLAIALLAVAECVRVVVNSLDWLTGGGWGMVVKYSMGPMEFYYATFSILVLSFFIFYKIVNSKHGLALTCIRDDEYAAEIIGINTMLYKVYALSISAIFIGICGGIWACYVTYVDPTHAFSVWTSFDMLLIVLLGGSSTLWGPIIGSGFYNILSEFLVTSFPSFHKIISGVILLFVVIFMPQGIYGGVSKVFRLAASKVSSNAAKSR